MFQANVLIGLPFFLAIVRESRRKALCALLGVLVPMLAIPFVPEAVWRGDLLGYNVVFCAIYWAGSGERRLLYALLSVVFLVFLELLALYTGLISLAAPFVPPAWGVVQAQWWDRDRAGALQLPRQELHISDK